jgi:excisionase family DNA binding protein
VRSVVPQACLHKGRRGPASGPADLFPISLKNIENLGTNTVEVKQLNNAKEMEQVQQLSDRQYLTTGQVARHCQVSIPALKRWIREGRLATFRTPGGHCRIALTELQRFLRQYRMPLYPASAPGMRILIVDDEPDIVDLFVRLLADDPRRFQLDTATDGYDALIKVGMFQPALLILDLSMPCMDGIEVCRRLKANPATQAVKILGITGYPHLIPALMEAGADACLTKPLALRHMQQKLERLLASLEVLRDSGFTRKTAGKR